jgi:hypothetical protein
MGGKLDRYKNQEVIIKQLSDDIRNVEHEAIGMQGDKARF